MMDLIDRAAILSEAKRLAGPQTGDGWDNWGVYALIERQPIIEAVPLGPLCEWLAGYADPPKYAMKIIPEGGEYLINARAKAWKHHFRNMMECGLMEEGQHDKG